MPDKFVTNLEVRGEIIKVKDENLNGTVNEIIDGTIDIPYVKRNGDTMTGDLNMGGNKVTNITNPTGNTDVTNKEYVDTEIANKIAQLGTLLEYKGTKPTVADLPTTGNKTGDVWYVEDVKSGYAWVNGHWEEFGPVINLEPYFKKSDIVQGTGNATDKVMSQKATTDAINAVDLTPYFEKSNVVQNTGTGTDKVMSQKATTDAINEIDLTPYMKKDGSTTMTGDLNVGNNKITNLKSGTTSTDGIRYDQVFPALTNIIDNAFVKAGTVAMTGNLNVGTNKIINLGAPVDNTDATTKQYVDNKVDSVPTYNLPQADNDNLGGIKAAPATELDTQDIRITSDGHLKTKASGDTPPSVVQNTGQSTSDVMSQKATTDAINAIPEYVLPRADNEHLGGVIARPKGANDIYEVTISPEGRLYAPGANLLLPQASENALGGVKAKFAQPEDTQDVKIDMNGFLKTKPGSGGGTGGGLSPITVTRDEAYISTPGNNNTTKVLADPTAPTDKPIQAGQIAVYSTTNQTYNTGDVGATLLVADPHSDMEAVNKRTNDTKLAKANINDSFKRVTAVQGSNPGTESYHILAKTETQMGEDRIPIYGANNTLTTDTLNCITISTYGNSFGITLAETNSSVLFVIENYDSTQQPLIIRQDDSQNLKLYLRKLVMPSTPEDATNKEYVDTHIAGVNLPTPDADGDYVLHYTKSTNTWSLDKKNLGITGGNEFT